MLGKICIWANCIVAIWGFFIPAFYEDSVVLLVALPCLSLMAMLFDPHFRRGFFTVLVPFAALLDRLTEVHQPGKQTRMTDLEFHWALVLTLGFVLVFVVVDRLKVWKKGAASAIFWMICLLVFSFCYATEAVEAGNVLLDHSIRHAIAPIKKREREVLHTKTRGRAFTAYFVTVNPPVELSEWKLPRVYDVGWEEYELLIRAPNLCIDTGDGAFGERWYKVLASCP